jgi:heme-degrading monooxygenase HmoA
MYCRYTRFSFDTSDRAGVHNFWNEVGAPVVARQEGFRGGLILDSDETDGVIRAITLWADRHHFDRFSNSDENTPIVNGIRSTTMKTETRDGLKVVETVEPEAGEVRVVRARIRPGCLDGFRKYWTSTGRALVESAPGCISAQALVDPAESEAIVTFTWRTAEHAEAFRNSPVHNEQFVPGIEEFVTPIAKLRAEKL